MLWSRTAVAELVRGVLGGIGDRDGLHRRAVSADLGPHVADFGRVEPHCDDRVPADQWSKRMEYFAAGEKVSILISRRDRLQRLDATFGQEPTRQWGLEAIPDATPAQKAHRKAWIGE